MAIRLVGDPPKRLAELSDEELLTEVQRRRKARGHAPALETQGRRAHQLAKYFANLELPPTANAHDVDAAYARLRAKYEPYLKAKEAERQEAAATLLASLEQAHAQLLEHLGRRSGGCP